VFYLNYLAELHRRLEPRRYLEIGVRFGRSLALSHCPSVGVDPDFTIDSELQTEVHLFRTTSDEYFSRPEPLAPVGGLPFDLAFIDGMHLLEFALRDFIYTERNLSPGGVIVFDDMLPRTADEAARDRHTNAWTGDIYPIIPILEKYRPDVLMIAVDTQPTGLLMLFGLDPTNTVLSDNYDAIMAEFRSADPQPVPQSILDRTFVQPPERILASPLLDLVTEAWAGDSEGLSARLRQAAAEHLGPAYAG
jgi:methyltransferase family protein